MWKGETQPCGDMTDYNLGGLSSSNFPCRRIAAAVIEQAIRDFYDWKVFEHMPVTDDDRSGLEHWFRSNSDKFGSFVYYCQIAEIDSAAACASILARAGDVTKIKRRSASARKTRGLKADSFTKRQTSVYRASGGQI